MLFAIIRLDYRYTGNDVFKYRLEFPLYIRDRNAITNIDKFQNYHLIREWLWENYGPSCERELYNEVYKDAKKPNPKWAWHYTTKQNKPLIYVADDATLAHLQLKWSA